MEEPKEQWGPGERNVERQAVLVLQASESLDSRPSNLGSQGRVSGGVALGCVFMAVC